MRYNWSEYQQFVRDTPEVDGSFENLYLYHYFDNLQWGWRYAVVLNDNILLISTECPFDFWSGATAVYELKEELISSQNTIQQETLR